MGVMARCIVYNRYDDPGCFCVMVFYHWLNVTQGQLPQRLGGLRSHRRLGQLKGAIPLSLGLLLLLSLGACSEVSAPSEPATDAASSPPAGAPPAEEPTEATADELAARAEWEAQMAQVRSVLAKMDRAELIGQSATKGPADAKVVLLKFSDFQCPYCAIAAADMKDFTEAHSDDVLYVYKQFPLVSIHPEAMPAAKAAWAAGQQDKFWIYHDGLFAYQDRLGEDYYEELAQQIGLDMEKFNRDRTSPEAQAAIEQDLALGRELGIRGTPTFLMNDLLIPPGAPLEFFEEATRRFAASTP